MKRFFITIISPLLLLLYLSACSKKVDDKILLDAHKAVENGAVIIDVRTSKEYGVHHLTNAMNIPLQELSRSLARVPKDRVLVLYCQSGSRSSSAAQILSQRGWKVYDVATESEYNREIKLALKKD